MGPSREKDLFILMTHATVMYLNIIIETKIFSEGNSNSIKRNLFLIYEML